jgi:hypothetical protein
VTHAALPLTIVLSFLVGAKHVEERTLACPDMMCVQAVRARAFDSPNLIRLRVFPTPREPDPDWTTRPGAIIDEKYQ